MPGKGRIDIEDILEPYPLRRRVPLSTASPELAAQWNYKRNCGYGPEEFSHGSNVRAWWICPNNHEYRQTIVTRVRAERKGSKENACGYCAGLKVCPTNSLRTLFPEIAKEWHKNKNRPLTPDDVTAFSHEKIWWRCKANHEWQITVAQRTHLKTGCPFCAGNLPTNETSLLALHPRLAKEWHKRKNAQLKPDQITAGSSHRAWWRCHIDKNHEWQATVKDRTGKDTGCPFCAGKKASTDTCLSTTHPEVAAQWHHKLNAPLKPTQVTAGSGKLVWWRCKKGDDHIWQATVGDRTGKHLGCPFCSNRRASSTNSLAALRPDLVSQWHHGRNRNLTPSDVTAVSGKSVWWRCRQNHAWQAPVVQRTRAGLSCPLCPRATPSRPRLQPR